MFVNVKPEFGGLGLEGCQVDLDSFVKFLGQLPYGFVSLSVEIVVALGGFVVEYLEGVD